MTAVRTELLDRFRWIKRARRRGLRGDPQGGRRASRPEGDMPHGSRLAALGASDRVVLVDDWAEKGSQALAARSLIEECGAAYVGLSLLVDQLPDEVRERLRPVHAVVSYAELPPSA